MYGWAYHRYSAPIAVTVPRGTFVDLSGKPFDGVAIGEWEFTTEADTYAPTLQRLTPRSGSSSVPLQGLELVIDWSEPVVAGNGNITVVDVTAGTSVKLTTWSDAVTVQGTVLRIVFPSSVAASGHKYSVNLDAGTVMDVAGNQVTSWPGWTFTGRDSKVPEAVTLEPAHDSTDLDLHTPRLRITFSEAVVPGDGSISLFEAGAGELVYSVLARHGSVVIDGSVVTVALDADVVSAFDTEYEVVVPRGAFLDTSGNEAEAIGGTSWRFTTKPDVMPPEIVGSTPGFGASGVDPAISQFSLTFDENIVVDTSGGKGVRVRAVADDTIVHEFDLGNDNEWRVEGTTATLRVPQTVQFASDVAYVP